MTASESLIQCKTCEELRPADAYYTAGTKSCKRCHGARARARMDVILARRASTVKRPVRLTEGGMSGKERRAFWATHKMRQGCMDCGSKDWSRLEFDHLPQYEKLFNIGEAVTMTSIYSDEEVAAEVAKCEVVCKGCHQKRTQARRELRPPVTPPVPSRRKKSARRTVRNS